MTGQDFAALLPLLVVAYGGVVLMAVVAFQRGHSLAFGLALAILAVALLTLPVAAARSPRAVTPLLEVDAFALYFQGLILVGALLVALLCRDYLEARERENEAFYVLLLMAVAGMMALASSAHFASFFLSLETLSVSLYGLIGYTRNHRPSLEGAVKYLVLAATSSAFLLFGIALVYSEFGTLDFRTLGPLMRAGIPFTAGVGLALILVAFGFKLAVAPFHMWSPDVYQGAPAPITALIATGSKGASFALLLRLVALGRLETDPTIFVAVAALAIATMFVGNLLALMQTNVKRLLAYSSIAHMGYLLVPLLAGGVAGASSIAFYLAAYFATTIAAFGVISVLSATRPMGDLEELDDYRGLALRHPALAALFSLSLLSLTGIPLTAGFIGKFYIFTAAAQSALWTLLIIGLVNSGISAFYYLRILFAMYTRPEEQPETAASYHPASVFSLAVSGIAILVFGIYPTPLLRAAEVAMQRLGF